MSNDPDSVLGEFERVAREAIGFALTEMTGGDNCVDPIFSLAAQMAARHPTDGVQCLAVTLARAAAAAFGSIASDHNTSSDVVLQDFMNHLHLSRIERREWPEGG